MVASAIEIQWFVRLFWKRIVLTEKDLQSEMVGDLRKYCLTEV